MIILVMGVTGSGKTTLGKALAERLGLAFYDADDYHPDVNRAKLRANIPLADDDRWPWLKLLANMLPEWEANGGAVLACSALKESYRQLLFASIAAPVIVYLEGTKQQIADRLMTRTGHELVGSFDAILNGQFRDLEAPASCIVIPISLPLEAAIQQALIELAHL